jgi:hypothetical protein
MRYHWPRWPTGSPDPIVNILATAALVLLGIVALATNFLLLVPIALLFTAIALYNWYHNRPPPYSNVALVAAATQQHIESANFPTTETFRASFAERLMRAWNPQIPTLPLLSRIIDAAEAIYDMEGFNNPVPPLPSDDLIEQGRYRDLLRLHAEKVHDAPRTLGIFTEALTLSLRSFRDALPGNLLREALEIKAEAGAPPPSMTIPLIDAVGDIGQLAYDVAIAFYAPEIEGLRLFEELKAQLNENDRTASGRSGTDVRPWEYNGSPRQIVDVYLRGTPLRELFDPEVPFVLPDDARYAGHWIVSPPGRGKTTLLHAMVAEDIRRPGAALILLDSKGDLIEAVRNLKDVQDRLVVIDPDPTNPVAINPLDIAQTDLAQSVDLLEYLFGSLLEFKMTAMQTTLFRSVLRALVMAFPNPTLETFRDLLSNGTAKYEVYIRQLPPDLQDFFAKDFNEKGYADRRREVLQRLRLLLDNETMRAILTATSTRFRIGEAMDTGRIVIINNSKARLGDQGSEFFGRFFIAQVLAAAQQRSTRKHDLKPPVYFYIDECQTVIARDEKIPTILDECRSQNIALIMAHQRTKQITSENVLDALSNCAIRFANSDEEARYLAPRLRTSPEFLQSLGRGRFAAFVRDMTPEGIAVTVHPADLTHQPQLAAGERYALQQRMVAAYGPTGPGSPAGSAAPPEADPAEPSSPADPILNLHHPDLPWRLEDTPRPQSENEPAKPEREKDPEPTTEGAPGWRP